MAQERRQVRGELLLENVTLRLKLGLLERERLSERDVPVTLSWKGEVAEGPSIDYSDVCEALSELQGGDYRYIEDVAKTVMRVLTDNFPGGRWRVTVRKPHPPVSLKMEAASFTLEGGENG